MAASPKVRPSFAVDDMKVIADACEYKLAAHVQAGDFRNPVVLTLDKIVKYCRTFEVHTESMESMFARFVAMQNGTALQATELPVVSTTITPIEVVELTDEQRYDMLKLRPAKSYSAEEQEFFLNKGTMIAMARMAKESSKVNEGDL